MACLTRHYRINTLMRRQNAVVALVLALAWTPVAEASQCKPECKTGETCVYNCALGIEPHCVQNRNFDLRRESTVCGKSFDLLTSDGLNFSVRSKAEME